MKWEDLPQDVIHNIALQVDTNRNFSRLTLVNKYVRDSCHTEWCRRRGKVRLLRKVRQRMHNTLINRWDYKTPKITTFFKLEKREGTAGEAGEPLPSPLV